MYQQVADVQTGSIPTTINKDQQLMILCSILNPILYGWMFATKEPTNHTKIALKQAYMSSFDTVQTWKDIQQKLNIKTYKNYYTIVQKCPTIASYVNLTWDQMTRQLSYTMITPYNNKTPPDNLQIPVLARMVERMMADSTGKPTIRATIRKPPQHKPRQHTKQHAANDSQDRQYIDIQCALCQRYGYQKIDCDKMAIWLILQENRKLLDDKLKQKLLDNYSKIIATRQTQKLQCIKGTVHQLYTDGHMEQADTLWFTMVPTHIDRSEQEDHLSTSSEE